jgi:hypothetical protein
MRSGMYCFTYAAHNPRYEACHTAWLDAHHAYWEKGWIAFLDIHACTS